MKAADARALPYFAHRRISKAANGPSCLKSRLWPSNAATTADAPIELAVLAPTRPRDSRRRSKCYHSNMLRRKRYHDDRDCVQATVGNRWRPGTHALFLVAAVFLIEIQLFSLLGSRAPCAKLSDFLILVPRHRGSDCLVRHSKTGRCWGGTSTSILRGTLG